MIVDTSAIIAVMFQESTYSKILRALDLANWIGVGAPTLAEAGIVIGHRLGFQRLGILHRFVQEFEIAVVSFDELHWTEAAAAYERFGRSRNPAGLNFGDCLSYAVAKLADRPLLCVGNDFRRTDLSLVQI